MASRHCRRHRSRHHRPSRLGRRRRRRSLRRPPRLPRPRLCRPRLHPPRSRRRRRSRCWTCLNDPRRRQEFTTTLDAIARSLPAAQPPAAATPGGEPPATAAPLAIPLAPDSLGAELVVGASDYLGRLTQQLRGVVAALRSVPPLWHWAAMMLTDPLGQALLFDTAWRLAVTLAAGLVTEFVLRQVLRQPSAALLARARPALREAASAGGGEAGHVPDSLVEEVAVTGAGAPDLQQPGTAAPEGDVDPDMPVLRRRRFRLLEPLRRVPTAALRLGLDLLPVLGFVAVTQAMSAAPVSWRSMSAASSLAAMPSSMWFATATHRTWTWWWARCRPMVLAEAARVLRLAGRGSAWRFPPSHPTCASSSSFRKARAVR